MDPVSQAVVGAIFTQSVAPKEEMKVATIVGICGGVAADIDMLIRSDTDSLLLYEYHRHFSHSLLFIPLGALLVALALWGVTRLRFLPWFKREDCFGNPIDQPSPPPFKRLYIYSLIGYATHGILDAFTAYGTDLFWPFTNQRVAWDLISIIDPIFTFTVLTLVVFAAYRKSRRLVYSGLIFMGCYLAFSGIQHLRAESAIREFAKEKGHDIKRVRVMPTLGNIILWRVVYQYNGHYYACAVRTGPFSASKIYPGDSAPSLKLEESFKELDKSTTLYKDLKRFEKFSAGFLIKSDDDTIGDFRYSNPPDSAKPMWELGYDINNPDQHAQFRHNRLRMKKEWDRFVEMLFGRD